MNESVFRAYDVRGIYPKELDESLAEKIGKAFGAFIYSTESSRKRLIKFGEEPVVAVGGDARIHTPQLKDSLIRGLLSAGVKVIDFGTIPTPLLYFATVFKRLDGGIVVTASHNPKEYNGFKFCTYGGVYLNWETGIKQILDLIKAGNFKSPLKEGEYSTYDITEEYKHYISAKTNLRWMDNMTVVIDAGNGVCGGVASDLFKMAGCKVIKLYCDPDGNFPNHGPDTIKKSNLADLQKTVLDNKAQLGIAYDGDGDRVSFVCPDGKILESQTVLSILLKEVLKSRPGAKIIFDVRASKAVEDVINISGGIPIESRVGRSYMQSSILNGCEFGGEHTGHYFFRENFGFDDGIFASIKFAEAIAKNGLDNLTKDLPVYFTSDEIRVFCKDDEKFSIIDKIKESLTGQNVTNIDGVKVRLEDGWYLIRASNTEPALTIRWESKTQEGFEKIKEIIKGVLNVHGLDTNW